MRIFSKGSRNLQLCCFDDIAQDIFQQKEYVVFINAKTEYLLQKAKEKMGVFMITPYCKEVFCIGQFAEDMHDALDYYGIDNSFSETVITTTDMGGTIDDAFFYFFETAGMGIANFFAFAGNDKEVESELIDFFLSS